jgi:hypothetical protein
MDIQLNDGYRTQEIAGVQGVQVEQSACALFHDEILIGSEKISNRFASILSDTQRSVHTV